MEKYTEDMFQGLDEEVTKYMTVLPYNDISLLPELQERVTKTLQEIKEHKKIVLAGIHKENSEFLGVFNISWFGNNALKGGIRIKKAAHGKGYGREGMLALIQRTRENIDFEYILRPVDKDNISSRKIAELAGGTLDINENWEEIIEREEVNNSGRFLNLVHYKIYKN